MRDIYTTGKNIKCPQSIYEKNVTKNHVFLVETYLERFPVYQILIADDLELSFGISEKWREKNSENLFLSMMNSIKIEKE